MQRQFLRYHPRIGHTFVPGLKTRVSHEAGGYLIRTNAAGFRCEHEFVKDADPVRRRILLFGDSFSAGDGVSNGSRFGDRLEQLVDGLQVYNYGLPGTGTDQQYLAYGEFAADVACDLLIIAVLVENIRRVVARYRPFLDLDGRQKYFAKPYYELRDGSLVLGNVPVPREPLTDLELSRTDPSALDTGGRFGGLRKAASALGIKDLAQRLSGFQPLPEYESAASPQWLLLRAILSQWIAAHNSRVLLVPLPLYQYVEETSDPTSYQERFRELAAEAGCLLHDPLPDLLRLPLAERRGFRFERDAHLTSAGHRALAASLAPAVSRGLTAVECRTKGRMAAR